MVAAALGSESGERSLVNEADPSQSAIGDPLAHRAVSVAVVPVHELVDGPVDVVKIDVEGAEIDVMWGIEKLSKGLRPRSCSAS